VQLGIDEVFAGVLLADNEHGVHDDPALARADLGVSIGAGTDVAIESAGAILASSDPRLVVSVMRLSQTSYKKEDGFQNLVGNALQRDRDRSPPARSPGQPLRSRPRSAPSS
jgi:Cu2+-exporting ATPase